LKKIKWPFQKILVSLVKNSRFRISLAVTLLMLCMALGIVHFICWQKGNDLTKELKTRGVTIVNMLVNQTVLAIKNVDDLSLLSYVNTLKEQDDIIYVVVLDKDARILAHTTTGKIGQVTSDAQDLIAYQTEEPLTRLIGPDLYDISIPLLLAGEKVGAARIGLSRKKIDLIMAKTRKGATTLAIIITILMGGALFVTLGKIIAEPISKINNELRLITKETLEIPKVSVSTSGELAQLAEAINGAFTQLKEREAIAVKESQEQISDVRKEVEKILALTPQNKGIIVTNTYYKIKCLNLAAGEILGYPLSELMEKHITEVIKADTFLDLLKEALNKPDQIIRASLDLKDQKSKIRSIEVELTAGTDKKGELISMVVGLSKTNEGS